jgi:hypothetical protein
MANIIREKEKVKVNHIKKAIPTNIFASDLFRNEFFPSPLLGI